MKFILFIFPPIVVYCQEPAENVFPLKDSVVYYESIVDIDSVQTPELFTRSKIWILSRFKSQKGALQAEDKELGYLMINTFTTDVFTYGQIENIPLTFSSEYWFDMKIYIKDEKVKIVVDNLRWIDNQAKIEMSILSYRSEYETESIQALELARRKKKAREKVRKEFEKFEPKLMHEVRKSFSRVDSEIRSLISSFESSIVKKSESEF